MNTQPLYAKTHRYIGLPEAQKEARAPMSWPFLLIDNLMHPWSAVTTPAAWNDNTDETENVIEPNVEASEDEAAYTYKVELQDAERDQVFLRFERGFILLSVAGEAPDHKHKLAFERRPGIRRAFNLPVYTNAEAVTAKLAEGELTITIPKATHPVAPQSHRIAIV